MGGTHTFQSSIDSKLVTISVMSYKSNLEHAHREIELIYIIKGNLQVKVNNKIIQMKSADFVLVNSNEFHSFQSEEDNLFVVFHFNYFELSSLLAQKNLLFTCNSIEHASLSDQELRIVIEDLLTVHMKVNNFSQVEFLEKTYKFISTLSINYLKNVNQLPLNSSIKGQNDRLTEIIDYIQSNYREPLSLEEVASIHYLSIPYLSKFFKKQTGKTFSQYLNEIRLAHAVNELVNSNKPITRIALDNGFPNLSAFNRVFNESYQLKPVEYRKQMSDITEKEEAPSDGISNQEMNEALSELRHYLKSNQDKSIQALPTKTTETEIVEIGKTDAFTKYWNKLLNIGYARDLLNSDMQEQINLLQSEIGFTYARFWGVFSDDMLLEDRSGGTITYNFSNTNKLLDFLVKNKLKPFIEIGPKPKIIQKAIGETLVVQTVSERNLEEWKNLVTAFLLQCIERYGIEEVETWYFEMWRPHTDVFSNNQQEGDYFLDKFKNNQCQGPSQFEEYFNIFSGFKKITQELVPGAKVGGCGLSMDLEGDKLDLLLQHWRREEIQPDFLSIYLYPIEIDRDKYRVPIKNLHSTNPDYVLNKLNEVRKSLKKAGFDHLELNVTEWNISISNRNFLNDSCFKASYMSKNIIENLNQNQVNMLGYWLCSDIFSDFRDSKNLLHGGAGLVTKNGVKKPSYHALVLLKQLGELLVAKGDNYIVTKKSGERYQVLCFNYKHFNYSYYLHPEGSTGIHEQYDIFENNEPLNLTLEIQGIANGKFRVKELKLNREHGSVLDEWLKFGTVDDMKSDEVDYLKQICVPYMKVEHKLVENHSIILNGELQPHEVRLFEFNLLFG
ncbi:helix-turn-helix domain-containing protein [Bacillus sp. ISL-46]|uniref:GH39 family glycosyl hydrolase n=1 Tax=Bacillus sp. ISL-46 TaxID=2819129 RepID=UPI001BE6DD51|nr:helix-turn-helix domain-containing protein [Bacillus sp. ISL-46]MBT2721127.1 helix-turn-helix domain-containing protein [Bacillus sp. ISL-46]